MKQCKNAPLRSLLSDIYYTVIMYIELYINKYIYSICKYVYLRGMGHHESWLLDFRYQR